MQSLEIIAATTADVPVIRSLAQAIWPVTYLPILSREQLDYMLELFYSEDALRRQMEHHQFILGNFEGKASAFASYGRTEEKNVFKLHKIYLSPVLQGKGMGKQLIDHVLHTVARDGATALDLNVNRENRAIGFYQKIGFEVIRSEDIDIGEGYWMNDFVMRYRL